MVGVVCGHIEAFGPFPFPHEVSHMPFMGGTHADTQYEHVIDSHVSQMLCS